MKIWCPYTDKEIEQEETSPEHIIPLALGGSNEFVIPVDKKFNSTAGSKIDGKYANDFLVMIRRNRLDARGHSKKRPIPIVKKGKREKSGENVQVNLDKTNKQIELFDPKTGKTTPAEGGEAIGISVKMDIDIYLQLAAKIGLSAGYFVYKDWFKNNVRHEDLRKIMKGPSNLVENDAKEIKTRVYHFLSGKIQEEFKQDLEMEKALCKMLKGSLVTFSPGPENIGITVGILGEFVAMLNIPADMKGYPRYEDEHDLGHVVLLVDGKMKRGSQRSYFQKLLSFIEKNKV